MGRSASPKAVGSDNMRLRQPGIVLVDKPGRGVSRRHSTSRLLTTSRPRGPSLRLAARSAIEVVDIMVRIGAAFGDDQVGGRFPPRPPLYPPGRCGGAEKLQAEGALPHFARAARCDPLDRSCDR